MKASIISISWLLAGRPRPLWQASASAGREGEHHQHQLAASWASAAFVASIISISWPLGRQGAVKASIISISWLLAGRPRPLWQASASAGREGEHHQHQLAASWASAAFVASIISISWPLGRQGAVKASIISISWLLAGRPRLLWQASSASASPLWVSSDREGEHHQSASSASAGLVWVSEGP